MTIETLSPATETDDTDTTEDVGGQAPPPDQDEDQPTRRDRRYRERLRETEATLESEREQWNTERAQHQQTIERYQRREVERAAAQAHMRTPADLWHLVGLDDLLTDGDVDTGKIDAAISRVKAERPHWLAGGPAAPASAVTGNHKPDTDGGDSDWTAAFRPRGESA